MRSHHISTSAEEARHELLEVEGLHAHYDKATSARRAPRHRGRRIVALLGRNGSGRSTTLKTIMGLVPPSAAAVRLDDPTSPACAFRIVRAGSPTCPRSARSSPT